MCLLSACQDVVIRTSSKTFIMHVSVPTRLCPHGERHSYAHIHMHAHKPFKIPSFSFSYSSSPNHPSSATVVFIQSCVWRLLATVSSNFPVIHSRTTDGSSPGWFFFFFDAFTICKLHTIKTLSELWLYMVEGRLFRGSSKGGEQQVLFCLLPFWQ